MGSVARRMFQVDVPHACFGVEVKGTRVVDAAPIGRWAIGRDLVDLRRFVVKRGGSLAEILPDGTVVPFVVTADVLDRLEP